MAIEIGLTPAIGEGLKREPHLLSVIHHANREDQVHDKEVNLQVCAKCTGLEPYQARLPLFDRRVDLCCLILLVQIMDSRRWESPWRIVGVKFGEAT